MNTPWLTVLAIANLSCSDKAVERAALHKDLRESSGQTLEDAATRYRAFYRDSPEALLAVAYAFERDGQLAKAVAVRDELAERGQIPDWERLQTMKLRMREQLVTPEGARRRDRDWLISKLRASPDCNDANVLVQWSRPSKPDLEEAIDLALAVCPAEGYRCAWVSERSAGFDAAMLPPDIACEVSSCERSGSRSIHERCAASATAPWKAAFARAALGIDRAHNLAIAASSPDASAKALLEYALDRSTRLEEACQAIDRAEQREQRWIPVAGNATTIEQTYRIERERLGCRQLTTTR